MIDKAAAEAEAQAKTEVKPEVKVEVKPEVKVEVKPEVETEAKPMDVDPPPQQPSSQATIQRQTSDTAAAMAQVEKEPLIKTILRRVLDCHEIKYHLSTLELDAKRKYSAKAASAVSHAMKKYNEHVEARNAKLRPRSASQAWEKRRLSSISPQAHKMLLAKLKEAAEPKKEEPPQRPSPVTRRSCPPRASPEWRARASTTSSSTGNGSESPGRVPAPGPDPPAPEVQQGRRSGGSKRGELREDDGTHADSTAVADGG